MLTQLCRPQANYSAAPQLVDVVDNELRELRVSPPSQAANLGSGRGNKRAVFSKDPHTRADS